MYETYWTDSMTLIHSSSAALTLPQLLIALSLSTSNSSSDCRSGFATRWFLTGDFLTGFGTDVFFTGLLCLIVWSGHSLLIFFFFSLRLFLWLPDESSVSLSLSISWCFLVHFLCFTFLCLTISSDELDSEVSKSLDFTVLSLKIFCF